MLLCLDVPTLLTVHGTGRPVNLARPRLECKNARLTAFSCETGMAYRSATDTSVGAFRPRTLREHRPVDRRGIRCVRTVGGGPEDAVQRVLGGAVVFVE